MKLAKKVLAVVMALGLIAVMSAMAFAANAGSYSFDVSKVTDGNTITATLYAHDYVGLASGTVTVNYSGVKFEHAYTGAQAKAVNNSLDNSFNSDVNNTQDGKVIYGFYFKENLWDANTFYENGDGEPLVIDVADFDIVSFVFTLPEGVTSYEISVNVSSKSVDGDNAPFADVATAAYEVPTSVKVVDTVPGTEEKKDDEKKCDDKKADDKACDNKAPAAKTVKTDGGKNTGDNGVIAVVAGVIALAGAAFVVTKKRK